MLLTLIFTALAVLNGWYVYKGYKETGKISVANLIGWGLSCMALLITTTT